MGVGTPGPAEEDATFHGSGGGEAAIEKDEAEWLFFGRAGGGDVAICFRMDGAVFEDGGAGRVDEVAMALDVAVAEVVAARGVSVGIRAQGVLPAEETAVVEGAAVATQVTGQGLHAGFERGGVFEGEIVAGDIAGIDEHGAAFLGGKCGAGSIRVGCFEVEIAGDDRALGSAGIAGEDELGMLPIDVKRAGIGSRSDVDDARRAMGRGRQGIEGGADVAMGGGAIGGDGGVGEIQQGGEIGIEADEFHRGEAGDGIGSGFRVVGVIGEALGDGRVFTGLEPEVEFFAAFLAEGGFEAVGEVFEIDEGDFFIDGELSDGCGVVAVGGAEPAMIPFPAGDGRGEDGDGSAAAGFADEAGEVVAVAAVGRGVDGGVVGFFIVVAELDDQAIAGLEHFQGGVPTAFGDEGFCAAAIARVVVGAGGFADELAEKLAPAAFWVGGIGFVGHGGIPDEMDGRLPGVGGQQGEEEGNQGEADHG